MMGVAMSDRWQATSGEAMQGHLSSKADIHTQWKHDPVCLKCGDRAIFSNFL